MAAAAKFLFFLLLSLNSILLCSSDTSSPGIITIPAAAPVTVSPPPVTAASPSGQKWCVTKNGAAQGKVQAGLDFACGVGKADCAAIQQGGSCYSPNTLQSHASYAFNSYFQRNPVQTSCDFGGAAALTNVNPSTGSCVFTTSSTPPTTAPPTTGSSMTPTGSSGGGLPNPNVLNGGSSNPELGGNPLFGGGARCLQPLVVVALALALHAPIINIIYPVCN